MSVRLGHASADERGGAAGGAVGDQTGREVCIRDWYPGGWNVVLRAKDPTVAEAMARFCAAVCANDNVGYDQARRNTLRDAARAAGWDASKIAAPCSTDCSALMTCCAEAAGVAVPYAALAGGARNAPVTQTMRQAFFSTGAFRVLLTRNYMDSPDDLKRGDILVRESGHTAMALSDGKNMEDNMTGKEILAKLTDEEAWQLVEKANRHASTLKPSAYAESACAKAITSGLFSDGDHNGMLDNPLAYVKRQEFAVVLDRMGELGGDDAR